MTSCAVTMCTRGSRVATLLGILATLKLFTSTNGEWKPCVPTMYICPSVSPSVRMYFDPSVLPSVCMFIRQSVRMYICLSVPSFRMSICSSVRSYVYLSVSPNVCFSVIISTMYSLSWQLWVLSTSKCIPMYKRITSI